MPFIVAWESDDPGICRDHMLNPADKELFCAPLPGFINGPGGSYPQKYLVWYVLNGSCKASPEKECFSLDWWENFAKYNPDPYNPGVRFMVRNRLDSSSNYDVPVDTDQGAWRIHPDVPPTGDDKCLFNYRWLKVYLDVKSSVGEITSSPSNEVTVICPQQLGDTVDVQVKFYSLTLDNIDDDLYTDFTEDTTADDVHGIFGTVPAGRPGGIHMGYPNDNDVNCYWNYEMGGYGCKDFNNGAYLLEDLRLCRLEGYGCQDDSEFNYDNNKISVTLRDQDTLQLFVNLVEYDNSSDDDTVCNSQVWLGPWPLTTWASLADAPIWLIMNDNGHASCAVEVILNTLKPGQ